MHPVRPSLLAPLLVCLALALCLAFAAPPAGAVTNGDPLDTSLLAGLEARAVGPAVMSGRIGAIEAVASDPDTIYVGAATGGLWKSVDGGLTWKPIFDDQPVAAIGAVAVSPGSPEVVWVGTGEGNTRNSVSVGNGVYKSLDGGDTWTHLGLDGTERIHRIVLHPTDPRTAYVAALGTTWGENPERGVFKTTDGGETWDKVLYVDEKTGAADLAIDPENPDKLFAAMWDHRRWPWFFRSGGPGSGLYVTHDGGGSWKRYQPEDGMPEGDLGRIGVAVSPSDPEVVYALVEAEKSAMLRSDDGGRTWKAVNTEADVANRPFYYADLRVDPVWPHRVYNLASRVRVSTDGGRTFEILGRSQEIHGDYQAMWIDPNDASHILIGTDGGMAISEDRGETWRFVGNLPLAQYYHVAVDMESPYNIYGGMQDNGSWRGPSALRHGSGIPNHRWQQVGFGDGFDTRPDPENARRGYSMWQGGHLLRWNLDSGVLKPIKPPPPEEVPGGEAEELRFNWNAGLAQDPFDPATIYYGSQYVHRSNDRGASWEVISPDLTTDNPEWQRQAESGGLTPDVTGAENFTSIIALAPSELEEGLLWVGTDDGRLHVTRNGGETWESLEDNVPGVPENTWIPHIEPSKHDPGEAFVVFDNHRRADWRPYVYRTGDFGASWQSLATGDLWGYALSIVQDPVEPDLLFLGTEFGLWFSTDGGDEWHEWSRTTGGVPTVGVRDLVIHPRDHDLVIGTHGRSAYVIDDITPLRALTEGVTDSPLHLFPLAHTQQYTSRPEPGGDDLGAGAFQGENRPYGALISFWMGGDDLPHPDPEVERERKEQERLDRKRGEVAQEVRLAAEATDVDAQEAEEIGEGESEEEETEPEKEEPKVRVEVADASGEVVRTFEAEVHQGLNRISWDLGRDPFDRPADAGWSPGQGASGPEVPPGEYTVTLRRGGEEVSAPVTVLADPLADNTPEDWAEREAAIERAGALQERLTAAVERIVDTRSDVEVILAKAKREQEEWMKDNPGAEKSDAPHADLAKAGGELQERLTDLEKRFRTPPDTRGIVRREGADWEILYATWSMTADWSPPNPTDLVHLERAEEALDEALTELDTFYAEDLPAFRSQVEESGLGLFAGIGTEEAGD